MLLTFKPLKHSNFTPTHLLIAETVLLFALTFNWMVAWVSAWPNFITHMLPWHFSYRHPFPHNYMRWLNLRIIHLLTWSFSRLVLFLGSLHGEILLTSLRFIIKVQMNLIHYKENIVKSVSNQNVKTKMNLIHFKKNIVELVSKQVVKMNLIYLK